MSTRGLAQPTSGGAAGILRAGLLPGGVWRDTRLAGTAARNPLGRARSAEPRPARTAGGRPLSLRAVPRPARRPAQHAGDEPGLYDPAVPGAIAGAGLLAAQGRRRP